MDIRSDYFYICLMIHCFILDYSEAVSQDELEEPTKKRSRRWTTDEEAKLIFFYMLTDTGERNHFDRVKNEWRREYPHSDVTDNSLRNKIHRLRIESVEEGTNVLKLEMLSILRGVSLQWKSPQILSAWDGSKFVSAPACHQSKILRIKLNGSHINQVVHQISTREFSKYHTSSSAQLISEVCPDITGVRLNIESFKDSFRGHLVHNPVKDCLILYNFCHSGLISCEIIREREKYFKWNKDSKRELLDIYYNTSPYKGNSKITLVEEWKRRHPDYQGAEKYLMLCVWQQLMKNKYLKCRSRDSSNPRSRDEDEGAGGKPKNRWTAEWKDKLRSLDKSTDTGEPYQFERIKSKWYEKYPDSNVTEGALFAQFRRLREGEKKGKPRKNIKWNEEFERELLNIYLNTYPYRNDVNITLEDEWNRRHPGYQVLRKSLVERARERLKENKYPEYKEQESSITNFQWNNHHDSKLIHIYNVALPGRGLNLRRTHQIWTKLHPQYNHVTLKQLKERIDYLKRNPPDENFPWTGEENQELLGIYDETMPNRENQGQIIYNIWSKRHPGYKFMTPYYLQIHASTLARRREVKAAGKYNRSKWTKEEKQDLVNMVHQFPRKRLNELLAFHEEWVRKHPRLAYKTNSDLLYTAKRFKSSGIEPRSVEMGEGSHSRVPVWKCRKHNKYTPKIKQELLDLFYRTFPKESKHANRLKKEWDMKYKDRPPIKASSLRRIVRGWEGRGPDKRADKAPIVYSSNESGSSSPPMMSEDSE